MSAYGITIVLLLGLLWLTWAQSRKIRAALQAAESRNSDD
ncbi:MAG: heme exporter protein CcmD [Paracoccaceae bacterium]